MTMLLIAGAMMLGGCGRNSEKDTVVKAIKVKTLTVETGSNADTQGYSGTIEEDSGTSLSFASMGTLKSVAVSEGQMVRQGQLLATIDEASVKSSYEAALAAKEQALDAEQRMKLLYDSGSLPEIKWVEVQTQVRQALAAEKIAKKALTDTRLFAPFSGYIAAKYAEAGQSVAPGVAIVKLVKIDRVKVSFSVPEEEISKIQKGQALHVRVKALDDKMYEARITEKGVTADALSHSYEVKGIIGNPSHELLPGMIAEVKTHHRHLSVGGKSDYALPAEMIQLDVDNRLFVWRVVDGKAQKAYVTLGQNIGDNVQIVEGLSAGDKVICEGQQKVCTGIAVTIDK